MRNLLFYCLCKRTSWSVHVWNQSGYWEKIIISLKLDVRTEERRSSEVNTVNQLVFTLSFPFRRGLHQGNVIYISIGLGTLVRRSPKGLRNKFINFYGFRIFGWRKTLSMKPSGVRSLREVRLCVFFTWAYFYSFFNQEMIKFDNDFIKVLLLLLHNLP